MASRNRIIAPRFSAEQARKLIMESIDPESDYDDDTSSDFSEQETDSVILDQGTSECDDIACIWSTAELSEAQQSNLTDRSFTHRAPVLWNSLPKHQFLSKLKTFLLEQSFPHSLVCTNSWRFSGPLTLLTGFIPQSFSLSRLFSPRSSTPVSVNMPPSVIAACQALCRHSKSPHWSSLTMVSGAIIIIIDIEDRSSREVTLCHCCNWSQCC